MSGGGIEFVSGIIRINTIVGLNSTEQEEKDDILRCELVVQRDGLPSGSTFQVCCVIRECL